MRCDFNISCLYNVFARAYVCVDAQARMHKQTYLIYGLNFIIIDN